MADGLHRFIASHKRFHALKRQVGRSGFGLRRSLVLALLSGEPPRFLERHGKQISEKVKSLAACAPDQGRDLCGDLLGGFTRAVP
jgi:hypothetical protein